MTYDPANGEVFVSNTQSDNVTVINGTTNQVVASIAVGSKPISGVFDPSNGFVYIVNTNSSNVSVINGTSNRLTATVPVGRDPSGIAYDGRNKDVYVDCWGTSALSVIDGRANRVVQNITVGYYTHGVVYDGRSNQLFVTNQFPGSVSVVDPATGTVVKTIGSPNPVPVLYDPQNGMVYAVSAPPSGVGRTVQVINGSSDSVAANLSVGARPITPGVDLVTGDVFIASVASANLTVFSGKNNSLVSTIRVGFGASAVTYVPHSNRVLVANAKYNTVVVVDPNTLNVSARWKASGSPSVMIYDPAGGYVYLAESSASQVAVYRS